MITILDGGMGGEIQKHLDGANHGLWSAKALVEACLLYTSPSPRDLSTSRMPSSA